MSIAMTREEREAFLADLHVGVVSVERPGKAPLTVPIWYAYEPGGEVRIITAEGSKKARLFGRAGRLSLCAQSEAPPYKYVSVEGPIVARDAADLERDLRPMARRYLGPELGDRYLEMTAGERASSPNVVFRVRPERWLSADYAKEISLA